MKSLAQRILLHAGDNRGGRVCLGTELLEPVGLAVLSGKRFKAGGEVVHLPAIQY